MENSDKEKELAELYDTLKFVNARERHFEDKVKFYRIKRKEVWEKILKLEGKR